MKKSPHTQEFLTELDAPQLVSAAQLEAEMLDVLQVMERLTDQVTRFRRILKRVELTEESGEIQRELEPFFQTVGAMEHSAQEWERRSRELVAQFYQLDTYAERFRQVAGGIGYTTGAKGAENGQAE